MKKTKTSKTTKVKKTKKTARRNNWIQKSATAELMRMMGISDEKK